jgi:hypothetical protein
LQEPHFLPDRGEGELFGNVPILFLSALPIRPTLDEAIVVATEARNAAQ